MLVTEIPRVVARLSVMLARTSSLSSSVMVIRSVRSKVTTVTGREGGGEGEGTIAGTVVVVGEGEAATAGTVVEGEGTTAGTIVVVGEGEGTTAGTVVEGEASISGTIVLALVGEGEGTTAGTVVVVGEGEVAFPISSG